MSSIFLSHNFKDKPFVRKLANDLQRNGFIVWVDEAEIKVGDSLIQKIREGIDRMRYIGVILSKNSIQSEWVQKEIDIAMNQEIEGKEVKVLPIMLEEVDLPGFLKGKLYADFTEPRKYKQGLKKIIDRLNQSPVDKPYLTPDQARVYEEVLKSLQEQLDISKRDRRLLLERLSIERRDLPQSLCSAIESENKHFPEFDDINRNFAFICGGMTITAGYVLHGLRKEMIKGGGHQIATWCAINDKTDELSLMVGALVSRLNHL